MCTFILLYINISFSNMHVFVINKQHTFIYSVNKDFYFGCDTKIFPNHSNKRQSL